MNMKIGDDAEYPFTYTFKDLNKNNNSSIMSAIEDFLENEKNNLKN